LKSQISTKHKTNGSCPDIKIPNINRYEEFNIKSRSVKSIDKHNNKEVIKIVKEYEKGRNVNLNIDKP